jgi:hypothetical protein
MRAERANQDVPTISCPPPRFSRYPQVTPGREIAEFVGVFGGIVFAVQIAGVTS